MRKSLLFLALSFVIVSARTVSAANCTVSLNAALAADGETIEGSATAGGSNCFVPASLVAVVIVDPNGTERTVAAKDCSFPVYQPTCTTTFSFTTMCAPRQPIKLRAYSECAYSVGPQSCRSERITTETEVPLDDTPPSISMNVTGPNTIGDIQVAVSHNIPHDNGAGRWETWEPYPNGGYSYNSPLIAPTQFATSVSCWPEGTYYYKVRYTTCYGRQIDAQAAVVVGPHKPTVNVSIDESNPNDAIAVVTWSFPNTNPSNASNTAWLDLFPLGGSHVWSGVNLPQTGSSGPIHLGKCTVDQRRVLAAALTCNDWTNGYAEQRAEISACDPQCFSCPGPSTSADDLVAKTNKALGPITGLTPASSPECPGDPIKVTNGNMRLTDSDAIPGEVSLRRTYDSVRTTGLFGRGWASLFDAKLRTYENYVVITDESGNDAIFYGTPAAGYVRQAPVGTQTAGWLHYDSVQSAYLYRAAGEAFTRVFKNGRLAALRPTRDANEISIIYGTDGLPTRVEDARGTFGWTITSQSGHIQTIVADGTSFTWTYVRDGAGNLISVQTPLGNWRAYEYVNGQLTVSRDGAGNIIESHDYDALGRAITSHGRAGEITGMTFGASGRVPGETRTTVSYASGRTTTYYTRQIAGRPRTVEVDGSCDCGGEDAIYVHDAFGRVIREQNAFGYITVRSYESDHVAQQTVLLRPTGCNPDTDPAYCRLTPDALASASLENSSLTRTLTFVYGDSNWPDQATQVRTSSVASLGEDVIRNVTYDVETGRALIETVTGYTGNPIHAETRITTTSLYDGTETAAFTPDASFAAWAALPQPRGYVKSVDAARTDVQDITRYVYYPTDNAVPSRLRGRLAGEKNAAGHVTFYADYDAFGNPLRVVDPNGTARETQYDGLGRVITSTVRGGSCNPSTDPTCAVTTTRSHFAAGPLTHEWTPTGVTVYTYDGRGRVESITRGPGINDLREKIVYTYHAETGRKTAESTLINNSGNWIEKRREEFAYDENDRLSAVVHPDGSAMDYVYGHGGRLKSVRDERHNASNTFYDYTGDGKLAAVRQQLGEGEISTVYTYDGHGNLESVTDPNGNTTTYTYDDFGQMLRQVSPVTGTTGYAYDVTGDLMTTTDANSAVTTRSYDVLSRVLTSTSARNGATETVTWSYDSAPNGVGRVASMQDPTGGTTYEYEHRGFLAAEAKTVGSATYTTRFAYDIAGNREQIQYPSSRIVQYTFDFAGRPISAVTGDTTIVASAEYEPFGPLNKLVYGNGTTKTVTFDKRYRPTTNTLTGSTGPIAQYAYQYDLLGNILSIQDQLNSAYDRTFAYDDLNRLTVANTGSALWGSGSYLYDAMGNMLSYRLGTKTASFAYGGTLPKLQSATENGLVRSVTYDPAGNESTVGSEAFAYSARNHLESSNEIVFGYDARGVRTTTTYPGHFLATLSLSKAALYPNEAATGSVTLSGAAPVGGVVVALSSSNPAVQVPASVTISAGSTTAVFGLTQLASRAAGSAEISATHGFSRSASIALMDGPSIQSVVLDQTTIVGSTVLHGTVTLSGPAPTVGATILLSTNGTFGQAPTSIVIPAGSITGSFDVATSPVMVMTTLIVTAEYGNSATASCAIDATRVASVSVPSSITAGTTPLGTVSLNGPAPVAGANVTLSSSAASSATVPASVLIPAGQVTQTFVITTTTTSTSGSLSISADYNGSASANTSISPCVPGTASAPQTPETDWIWIDDQAPEGASASQGLIWDGSQHASGAASFTRPSAGASTSFTLTGASTPLAISYGQNLVFYALFNECQTPTRFTLQFRTTNGVWQTINWGLPNDRGPLPSGGVWTRFELSGRELGIENMSIDGVAFGIYGNGTQIWIDRVGKSGEECYPESAASPAIPEGDTVWIDDVAPAGAIAYSGTVWDTAQKASGTQSFTRRPVNGDGVLAFQNATTPFPITYGEKLFFYVLLNSCAPPSRLQAQFDAGDGVARNVVWGGGAGPNYVYMGDLPVSGTWARLEIPANLINLEAKSIKSIAFYVRNGQVWIDRIGKSGNACYPTIAPQPTIADTETIWIDDAAPAGASTTNGTVWDTTQKASGTQSFTRPAQSGQSFIVFENAAIPFAMLDDDAATFYVLLNHCVPPTRLIAQWVTTDGAQHNALWGQPLSGHTTVGPLPAADVWTRLEVPASALGIGGKSIKAIAFYIYDGQIWIDRVGKRGCAVASPQPTIPDGETVWIDDAAPDGASMYPGTVWDTWQKASGTRSFTNEPGKSTLLFSQWATTAPVTFGESMTFYALINGCTNVTRILADWSATDGVHHYALWGEPLNGYPRIGPLPALKEWTRLEVPVSLLGLEGQSVTGVAFYLYGGGQIWIDRVGKAGTPCYPVIAPAPTIPAGETIWIDDDTPAGAVVYGGTIWDTTQAASGSRAFTTAPLKSVMSFTNWTSVQPVAFGESVSFYALLNGCTSVTRVIAQWVTTDGVQHNALWGEAMPGYTRIGPLPAPDAWARLDVAAHLLAMEGQNVAGIAFYVYGGGQLWIDRLGKFGDPCYPTVATEPGPVTGDTIWIDDAAPAGASTYGPTVWDSTQHASGSQSITRRPALGENAMGFSNATTTMSVDAGEKVVFYVKFNECARPRRLLAQWATTDGGSHNAVWGDPMTGFTTIGSVPANGEWNRMEVPASVLGLEGKVINGVFFYSYDGQAWIDRIGKAPAQSAALNNPGLNWRSRFRGLFSHRTPVSLTVSAKYIETNTDSSQRKISLYSPELQLLAESEITSASIPSIEHEYIYFGGQPVAQVEKSTGTIDYYFDDHVGTPILQTSSTGAVTWRAEYEPYGTLRSSGAKHQPLRFPGQEDDGVDGVHYNVFRWYRDGWGRYTQVDPVHFFQPLSEESLAYGYAINNPLMFTDPLGLYVIGGSCARCLNVDARDTRNMSTFIAAEVSPWCRGRLPGIADVRLRNCIRESCRIGRVECKVCDDPGVYGETELPVGGHWMARRSPVRTAYVCLETQGNYLGEAGNTVIHEWAHGCGCNADVPGRCVGLPGIPTGPPSRPRAPKRPRQP